jgi:hypothetical protein
VSLVMPPKIFSSSRAVPTLVTFFVASPRLAECGRCSAIQQLATQRFASPQGYRIVSKRPQTRNGRKPLQP